MRLLSFLTEIERAVAADEPSPLGGTWENSRTVNYHEGLARLTLIARAGDKPQPVGTVVLQSFVLADGSRCLKAYLSWKDGAATTTLAVYETPALDWPAQARAIATTWLNEFATQAEAQAETTENSRLLAAG
ncbi:MAG TPA: hypothetical protein VFE31_04490 [Opitutaceae bacterium]|jgi:hypothetical protein|nr:hypothetical protein [Opitutaceae bacterium]